MKIKPSETVTVGEKTYVVAALPDNIKSLMELYDDIRRDQEKARIEFSKCQAALRDLGNQVVQELQKFEQETSAAAEQAAQESDDDE